MAVSLLSHEVSDLCLGKPALRSLAVSATVGEALTALKRSGDRYLSEHNLKNPAAALHAPVSVLVPKGLGVVRHLEPHSSLLEAIDLILEGAQNLVIPIHSPFTRKKLIQRTSTYSTLHNNLCYNDPASSALPLISESLVKQTSVAIVDIDGKLFGEISPCALNSCNESLAAAIATLSAGDLMAYIDCGDPPEDLIRLVKERLEEKNLCGAIELMEEEWGSSGSSSASYSSSSDEEFGMGKSRRLSGHSIKVARNTDAILCFPWSSLVAVMIQALSHRVSYVWVVEEDGTLVGVVTFTGMLKVFRERLNTM
ncbi:CBS domain-containing protein [Euphorbia peplus]|nr:CBS domain-containing protein [Euphorbia peplus]